jgi:NADPH:quinone reductase-like Zn-dependent oxidoreductase
VASGDQVVVEVAAAGVNPFDVLLNSGTVYAKCQAGHSRPPGTRR